MSKEKEKQQSAPASAAPEVLDPTAPVPTKAPAHFAEPVPRELGGEDVPDTAVAVRTTSLLADPETFRFDLSGLRPPILKIVHAVGKLAAEFNQGDLVLANKTCLYAHDKKDVKKGALRVIILNIAQYYKEYIGKDEWEGANTPTPRTFNSLEEAKAVGLRTEWTGPKEKRLGPQVSRAMDVVLLIERPLNVDSNFFPIDIGDGKEYALALFPLDKRGYEHAFRDIAFNIPRLKKAGGLWHGEWTLHTYMSPPSKGTGNTTMVPGFVFTKLLEAETAQAIRSVMATPGNG